MSKARLVILSVIVEGRSQADTARAYGVSPGWVSKLVARYKIEGDAAFEPRSRRPPHLTGCHTPKTVALILEQRETLGAAGLDNGPHTIGWHLHHHHGLTVSASTIWRHLNAAGLTLDPTRDYQPHTKTIKKTSKP